MSLRFQSSPEWAVLLFIVGSLFVAGCASSGTSAANADSNDSAVYERIVEPFDVIKQDGTLYELPFLGGFNVPRPQFHDLDAYGDLDLFIQEVTGSIILIELVGSAGAPPF